MNDATVQLREGLDEREIEYKAINRLVTDIQRNGLFIRVYDYGDDSDCQMSIETRCKTPEQAIEAIAATLGPDTDGRMSGFTWHLMADGWPEKGKNDYIIMGIKGGLYLAPRFEGYGDTEDTVWFRDTRGNHHYPAQVLAWAEIPPLEVDA